MTNEDRFLFLATRQKLNPEQRLGLVKYARDHALQWELVFAAAEANGVAPLIYTHVMSLPELASLVPASIASQHKLATIQNVFSKKERMSEVCKALKFLRERQIAAMLIKGAAQDLLVYDEPWYTVSNDTDLILKPREEALSPQLIREINDEFYPYEFEFDFFEHHDITINGMLQIDFTELWRDAKTVYIQDEAVYVLCPEDHLLTLAINSCRKRFFRLKSLLDINEAVQHFTELDWKKFCQRCLNYHCSNIVFTAFLVAQKTLGCEIPSQVMRQLEAGPIRAALLRLGVLYLMRFWSLSTSQSRSRILGRYIDPTLILPYAAYHTNQIWHKANEIRSGQQ
jgi:hypothetical protein